VREVREKNTHAERLLHYRRALFAACGGDRAKVNTFMRATDDAAIQAAVEGEK
jgi:hypothetical protein